MMQRAHRPQRCHCRTHRAATLLASTAYLLSMVMSVAPVVTLSSTPQPFVATTTSSSSSHPVGNVLILDHLNINHEKGRHDLLKAFYFDFLRCAVDPRKAENLAKGTKTLWANVGAHQFHLPEGKPHAQVLDGLVTLSYQSLDGVRGRYDDSIRDALRGSKFDLTEVSDNEVLVTDPWGTTFRLISDPNGRKDPRGTQSGEPSEGLAMVDLTLNVPRGSNFAGIGRFYKDILGAPVMQCDGDDGNGESRVVVSVGPSQTLTFVPAPEGSPAPKHDDLTYDDPDAVEEEEEGQPRRRFPSNYGPHVSFYVSDLRSTYRRASDLGVAYVNPRFKRRAYDEEGAVGDCMFRCLDIVDPDDVEAGAIVKLEHEVRSVLKRDGTKYKSCPFDEIPVGCVI